MNALTILSIFHSDFFTNGDMNILFIISGFFLILSLRSFRQIYLYDWDSIYTKWRQRRDALVNTGHFNFNDHLNSLPTTWRSYKNEAIFFLNIALIFLIVRLFIHIDSTKILWVIILTFFSWIGSYTLYELMGSNYISKNYPDRIKDN